MLPTYFHHTKSPLNMHKLRDHTNICGTNEWFCWIIYHIITWSSVRFIGDGCVSERSGAHYQILFISLHHFYLISYTLLWFIYCVKVHEFWVMLPPNMCIKYWVNYLVQLMLRWCILKCSDSQDNIFHNK